MPRRQTPLAPDVYYHVFNRTVGDTPVFNNRVSFERMLDLVDYYRFEHLHRYSHFRKMVTSEREKYLAKIIETSEQIVQLYTAEFMPNHFHFVLKQLVADGIRDFIANIQNAFAKYFNLKEDRHGALFQSAFKAIHIKSEEQLKHIIRYNHLNPVTANLISINRLPTYQKSSFQYYYNSNRFPVRLFSPTNPRSRFIDTSLVLSIFTSPQRYWKFVHDQADYQRSLGLIRKLIE